MVAQIREIGTELQDPTLATTLSPQSALAYTELSDSVLPDGEYHDAFPCGILGIGKSPWCDHQPWGLVW